MLRSSIAKIVDEIIGKHFGLSILVGLFLLGKFWELCFSISYAFAATLSVFAWAMLLRQIFRSLKD